MWNKIKPCLKSKRSKEGSFFSWNSSTHLVYFCLLFWCPVSITPEQCALVFSSQPGNPILSSHLLPDRVKQHEPPIPDGSLLPPLLGKNLQTYFCMSSLGCIQEARLYVGIRDNPQRPNESWKAKLLYCRMVSFCLYYRVFFFCLFLCLCCCRRLLVGSWLLHSSNLK